MINELGQNKIYELAQAKRGLTVIFVIVGRDSSVIKNYKSFHWFFANTWENQYYGILLKYLRRMFHISYCDIIYYVIYLGAAVVEWWSSWLAELEVRGLIPCLATWISEIRYLLLPSCDMAEIPPNRRKSSMQPTNQRHLHHLLALRQKSHKFPFRLGQLICLYKVTCWKKLG